MPTEHPTRHESLPNDERPDDPDNGHADRRGIAAPVAARTRGFEDGDGRSLVVRPCDPAADRDALRAMYDSFDRADRAQGIPPMDPDDRRDWLDTLLGGRNYVVEDPDGGIVGHAVLLAEPGSATAELAVFVAPGSRGAGVGMNLLRSLLADPPAGVETVRLSVERDNRAAVALYRKIGFEVVDRRRYELVMAREPGKIP